jgi:RNA polymerase sigma factor (sigma-70 family)
MSPPVAGARKISFLHEDARLFNRIREGDEQALVDLFEKNRRPVTALVTRNNGSPDDAEDILQEALIILWERIRTGKYVYKARLGTFVFATARNLWLQRLARKRREITETDMRLSALGGTGSERHSGKGSMTDPETDDPDPLELLANQEESGRVAAAIDHLGDPCRRLLLLYYWEELSMEDIAQKMGFANADTAKSKKYQCKKALEQLLKEILSHDA